MMISDLDSITVLNGHVPLHPCRVPPRASLLGLILPDSYVHFVGRFGYGLYGGLLHIFPWAPGYGDDIGLRSQELRNMFAGTLELDIAELDPDGSPGELLRSVPFGISVNGDTLCWDPDTEIAGEPEVTVVASKVLAFRRSGMPFGPFLAGLSNPEAARILWGTNTRPIPPTFVPSRFFDDWHQQCRQSPP